MSLNWDQLETPVQAFYKKRDRRRNQLPFITDNLSVIANWEIET